MGDKMLDQDRVTPIAHSSDPVPVLLEHLAQGNDVIRTGAVRAVAAVAAEDNRVREALLGCLLDEDPDVRTDAMTALVQIAKPEDAKTLRRSLVGDPVREVKQAAIKALARLNDTGSVDLLRKLVASRAEADIAWEDELDTWDDWLDVQIVAIEALGHMNALDAINDFLAARDDEEGQVLDAPVFSVLADMGQEGAVWLLSVAQTEKGLGRKRALETLARMQSDLLVDYVEIMLHDSDAQIRLLAIPLISSDDPRIAGIALNDPDAELRCEALKRHAPHAPEIAVHALSDAEEDVQAAALDLLTLPLDDEILSNISTNVMAWAQFDQGCLASAAVRNLSRFAPDHAAEILVALIADTTRPLDARLSAVAALAELNDENATDRLVNCLRNETQQIRAVALTHLAKLGRAGDLQAVDALSLAIDGTLLDAEQAVVRHTEKAGPDLGVSKSEDARRGHLRISRDGEIINDDEPDASMSTQSTLEAIQSASVAPATSELVEETPEEAPAKRRRRRSIEGPDDVGDDLRAVSLGIAGDLQQETIAAAVRRAAASQSDTLRHAAYRAILNRTGTCVQDTENALLARDGLEDDFAAIRSLAAETLALMPDAEHTLAGCLKDSDALVRAVAVRHCASSAQALNALADPTLIVRRAALDKLLADEQDEPTQPILNALMQAERIDTLAEAAAQSGAILAGCFDLLCNPDQSPKETHILLEAIARIKEAA